MAQPMEVDEPRVVDEGFLAMIYSDSVYHMPFRHFHDQEFLSSNKGKCLRVRETRLPSHQVPAVRDNKTYSCVPLSFLSAMEGSYCRKKLISVDGFTLQNTIDTSVETPFFVNTVLNHVCTVGVPRISDDEEVSFARVEDYFSWCSGSLSHTEMTDMLRDFGPLFSLMITTKEMEWSYVYKKSIYSAMGPQVVQTHPKYGVQTANHALILIGWGEVLDCDDSVISRYWIAQNNWGEEFGEGGVFRIWMEVDMTMLCFRSVELYTPSQEHQVDEEIVATPHVGFDDADLDELYRDTGDDE